MEYALRFGFQASNNEVEYEVVIVGINLAHSMEADQLEMSSDSQLVKKTDRRLLRSQRREDDLVPQEDARVA